MKKKLLLVALALICGGSISAMESGPYSKDGQPLISGTRRGCIFFPNSGIQGKGLLACHEESGHWSLRHAQSQCVTGTPLGGTEVGKYRHPSHPKTAWGTLRLCTVHVSESEIAPKRGYQLRNTNCAFFPAKDTSGPGLLACSDHTGWTLTHASANCAVSPTPGIVVGSYTNPQYRLGMLGARRHCEVSRLLMATG